MSENLKGESLVTVLATDPGYVDLMLGSTFLYRVEGSTSDARRFLANIANQDRPAGGYLY